MDAYPKENDYQASQAQIIQEQEKIIKELNMRIMELEDTVQSQREANRVLQMDLAAVRRDRDECLKALQTSSVSPIFNASTQKREEFWKIIHENVAFLREKNKFETESRTKLEEKDDEILKQRIMIEHLRKEIANNQIVADTNQKLKIEVENLYDNLLKEQAKNKDLTLRIMALEKEIQILEQKGKETATKLGTIDTTIKRQIEIFTEEQKSIMQSIKRMNDKNYYLQIAPTKEPAVNNIANVANVRGDAKPIPVDTNIDQFIMRLKTSSIHTDKYWEIIDVLVEMLRSAKASQDPGENIDPANPTVPKYSYACTALLKKLEDPKNYKFFLKALQSTSAKVVISSQNLIFEIGNFTSKAQEFLESGSLPVLVKTLKGSNDPLLKMNSLVLLSDLAQYSPKVSQELYNNGLSFFLATQLKKSFNEAQTNIPFLLVILRLISYLLRDGFGRREFVQDDLLPIFFSLLLDTTSWDMIKSILRIVPFLSESKENRMKIYESGGFGFLWKTFLESEKITDKEVLYLSVGALVQFVKDERIQLLFMTSEKIFETFEIFSRCLSFPNTLPPVPKAAALEILSELMKSAAKNPEFERYIIQNNIMKILLDQLKDGDPPAQIQCLNTLIFLKDFIFKNPDQSKIPIKTLTSLLGSKDKDVVILTLRFIDIMADHENMLNDLANVGITSVVSSFFIHNPQDIDPTVLVEAGYFLLKLEDHPVAVKQMLEAQTLLSILPLAANPNPEIKRFWYHAIAEFLNHREFRAQLEGQAIYLNFIKKAIQEFDIIYAEQLCFAMRVLFQSRLLANFMADEATISSIYSFIYEFSKDARPEFIVYMLETLALLAHTNEGRKQLLENTYMLDILSVQMQKEDARIADTAGRLTIFLLENSPGEDLSLLRDAVLDGVMIYSQSPNQQSKAYANTIISILEKDPEFAKRIEMIQRQREGDIDLDADDESPPY